MNMINCMFYSSFTAPLWDDCNFIIIFYPFIVIFIFIFVIYFKISPGELFFPENILNLNVTNLLHWRLLTITNAKKNKKKRFQHKILHHGNNLKPVCPKPFWPIRSENPAVQTCEVALTHSFHVTAISVDALNAMQCQTWCNVM